MLVIQIDHFEAEPLQARVAGLPDIFGAAVDAVRAAGVLRLAELGRDDETVAPFAPEGAAEQFLVLPPAIHVGTVEMIDPEIERAMDQLDPGLVLRRPVSAGQRHAAEPDRQYLRPVPADPPPPALPAIAPLSLIASSRNFARTIAIREVFDTREDSAMIGAAEFQLTFGR